MQASQVLQAVARALAEPILIFDRDGRCLEVVEAAVPGAFRCGNNAQGHTLYEMWPHAKAERFLGWIRQVLQQNEVLHYEFCRPNDVCEHNRRSDASGEQWFEVRIAPLETLSPDGLPCVAWLMSNITRTKALQRQLQYMAVRDALTGLSNRHAFDALLPRMLDEHRRRQETLTLALLDLDYFKQINDRFGHPTGDAVLRHFAGLLQDCVRAGDVAVRLGGEEFGLLMPNTRVEAARQVLQRLRERLLSQAPRDEAGETIALTFSAGLLAVQECANAAEAYYRVDTLLYCAKHAGRDQVFGPEYLAP